MQADTSSMVPSEFTHKPTVAFKRGVAGACLVVLALFTTSVVFLLIRSLPVVLNSKTSSAAVSAFTAGQTTSFIAYVGPLVFGTLVAAILALLLAMPLAVGVALFISQYARGHVRAALSSVVDVLAAIPSVIYGLWGALVFVPASGSFWAWVGKYFGWIPLFSGTVSEPARTMASAAVVLAIMIVPIAITICRDAFAQTPQMDKEAALALGATKWEMVRAVVLPSGRSAIVASAMLGFGRALGETMAVLMILSPARTYSLHLLSSTQNQTIAANIAAQFPEADNNGVGILIASGIILFVISFVANVLARKVTRQTSQRNKS